MTAKVVLTDYVWDSLDVERRTLEGLATLVPLQTKTPDQFLPEAEDCDALLNTYAGPITADVMARMPRLLAAARKIAFYERLVRGGRWELPPGKPLYRLVGQTLGLVGFGNIARAVAVRAHAFGL